MQDSTDIRAKYSNMLLQQYASLNPEFILDDCNYGMLNTFYNIVGDVELKEQMQVIIPFIQDHSDILKKIILANHQQFIFSQPAFLLVNFLLYYCNNKIIDEWPYDYESLVSVVRWSGYSLNILYDA